MWVEIIKEIWGIEVGTIRRMHPRKAEVIIKSGHAKKSSAPKASKKEKKKTLPKAETATSKLKTETANLPPVIDLSEEKNGK